MAPLPLLICDLGGRNFPAVLVEDVHELVDVVLVVLDRDGPLLFLARRLEDSPVDEPVPRRIKQRVVDRLEVPVVHELAVAERDRALAPEVGGVRAYPRLL